MSNVLMTYLGVGAFLLAGLIFALLVKPDTKHKPKHDK